MVKWCLMVKILLCVVLFGLVVSKQVPGGAQSPIIYLPQHSSDLVEAMAGEFIEYTFRVSNTGDEVLEIIDIEPG